MVGLHPVNNNNHHLSFTSVFLLLLQLSARSLPSPAPDLPELPRPSRHAPGRINCSDCKQQLTNRIRQMQHLERMKQRIMSAIRNNGNHVVPSNEASPRAAPKVKEGVKVGGGQSRGSDAGAAGRNVVSDSSGPASASDSDSDATVAVAASASGADQGVGRPWSLQQKRPRGPQEDLRTSSVTYPSPTLLGITSPARADETSTGPGVTHLQGRRKWKARKGSRKALIETKGPNIVSFSRVVSSGKRKHILQFTLKPMAQGRDLEVVKAHLWLLLTRSPPAQEDPSAKEAQVVQHKRRRQQKATPPKAGDSAGPGQRSRSKIQPGKELDKDPDNVEESNSSSSSNNNNSSGSSDSISRSSSSSGNSSISSVNNNNNSSSDNNSSMAHSIPNIEERQKRSASSASSSANKTSSQSPKPRRGRIHPLKPKRAQPKEEVDVDKEEGEEEENDERFQAVLRILLLAENGTRTLMTYLRTNVKVTHWQKVRLPVSVIQKQLQSSQNTLTLLIRCRRCGEGVQMVLPKQKRSKSRRKERRKRKRKDREKKKSSRREKKRRRHPHHHHHHHKRRRRRHGVWGREKGRRQGRKERRRQFRPLPFLVINTRLRSDVKASV